MAGSAADFTESPIERLAFHHAGDAEHPRPVMSAGDQKDGAQAALSGSYRETATPSRSLAAALPSSLLIRKPASLRGSGLRRTVEASRPEGANPPAGSSGFPCSLQHRRLSAISLRGSLPVRSTVSGRFRGWNVVNLAAQSKCFFGCPQCCNVGVSWRGPQEQGAGNACQIVPRW